MGVLRPPTHLCPPPQAASPPHPTPAPSLTLGLLLRFPSGPVPGGLPLKLQTKYGHKQVLKTVFAKLNSLPRPGVPAQ